MAERGLLARVIRAKLLLFSGEDSAQQAEGATGQSRDRRGLSKRRVEALRGYCSDRMIDFGALGSHRRAVDREVLGCDIGYETQYEAIRDRRIRRGTVGREEPPRNNIERLTTEGQRVSTRREIKETVERGGGERVRGPCSGGREVVFSVPKSKDKRMKGTNMEKAGVEASRGRLALAPGRAQLIQQIRKELYRSARPLSPPKSAESPRLRRKNLSNFFCVAQKSSRSSGDSRFQSQACRDKKSTRANSKSSLSDRSSLLLSKILKQAEEDSLLPPSSRKANPSTAHRLNPHTSQPLMSSPRNVELSKRSLIPPNHHPTNPLPILTSFSPRSFTPLTFQPMTPTLQPLSPST